LTTLNKAAYITQINARLAKLTALIAAYPPKLTNVSRGELGVILYYFYLSRALSDRNYAWQGYARLSNLLRQLTSGQVPDLNNPTLANGLAGLGMTLEIVINEGFIEDEYNDFLRRIDQQVFDYSLKKIQQQNTDFLHGGTGGFHYLYYRLERNPAVSGYLSDYVNALASITQAHPEGAYIRNGYMDRSAEPGEINLGLSHGMAATVLVLLNLIEAGIEKPLADSLVRAYIRFILNQENLGAHTPGINALYPNTVLVQDNQVCPTGEHSHQGGLRWCYGDMNITHLLYKAAAILQEPAWFRKATEVGLATLAINDIAHARCHGSLFCHGATGIAHYYDYLRRISGVDAYQQGHNYWLNVAADEFTKEDEHASYLDISSYFLEGSVGSGLVLMNTLLEEPAYWEKIWLLS